LFTTNQEHCVQPTHSSRHSVKYLTDIYVLITTGLQYTSTYKLLRVHFSFLQNYLQVIIGAHTVCSVLPFEVCKVRSYV